MTKKSAYPTNIWQLTALRFFAAFWVVIFHFRTHLSFPLDDYTLLFQKGYLGVDLFFVLSGFVLAHVYSQSLSIGTFSYRAFLQKRIARIYPLHLLTFLAAVGIFVGGTLSGIAINSPYFTLNTIPQNLFLIHAWGTTSGLSWNGPSWSISAEAAAYILFPVFSFLVYRTWSSALGVVVVCAFLFITLDIFVYSFFGVHITTLTWNAGVIRIVPEFLLGLALYRLGAKVSLSALTLRWAVPVSLFFVLASTHFGVDDLSIVIQLSILIFLLSQKSKVSSPSLQPFTNWSIYLGEISYSIYMVHSLVAVVYFKAIKITTGQEYIELPYRILSLFLVIGLSALLYHLVELPGRHLLRPRAIQKTLKTEA